MSVAVRKGSWEEHVTHASGSQYSYDDLDLVCCHGVDVVGSWRGAGSSKQGQRTRCASMPEGCHQLPTEEPSHTFRLAATVNPDDETVQLNDVKVALDLEEEPVLSPYDLVDVDVPQGASESEPRRDINTGSSVPTAEKQNDKVVLGDDNHFKCPHIAQEEQQRISVPSNNEPLLSECVGQQTGQRPNHQQTMENYAEGHGRPPGTFDITLNKPSAAGLESPNDPSDAEAEEMSTEQAGARLIPPFGEQHRTHHVMQNGDETSQAGKGRMDLDGFNVDEVHGKEMSSETSLVPSEAAMTPREEAGQCKEGAGLRLGEDASSDERPTAQCCFALNENVDTVDSGGSMETYLETETSSRDDEGGSCFNGPACHQNPTVAVQFENSCLKLDPIPEVSHSVLHDTPEHPCKNSNFTPNPDVQPSNVDHNYTTAEKVSQNLPPCSAEDRHGLSPQRLHSNPEASGRDSPGSEVADGYTAVTVSGVKVEAADLLKSGDARGSSPAGAEGEDGNVPAKKVNVVFKRAQL